MNDLFDMTDAERNTVTEAREILARFVAQGPLLTSYSAVIDYLHLNLVPHQTERFHVLFLDTKNRLIEDWCAGVGTVNHVPVYPREVVRKGLALNAASMILCHNHPSGHPDPSKDDISMTRKIRDAAQAVDITLHDHIIVAASADYSFRANGNL